ncbi:alpha/beta fold hydrolase [Dyadobacter subterraneus]|uniref:Alpha/beta hydrolase n=1 Tax=Dyadobacter subterraneus TaxID=2773304 RepID=A0ABR9WDH5_9BACT|nr:alpha/beta hydrolase [Dyadobacter subterraneus]MBE9463542.1 alpha/beta hydrolase [Dyadobacter subterraneus]
MKLIFTALLLYPFLSYAQTSTLSDEEIHQYFLEAKTRFSAFEKIHGHFIETANVKMHYLTWGKPSGTPFIWIHGSLSSAYEILPFADKLVKAGYYVIAIDYYGHGQTNIPEHEVSLYHVADDIKFLMDRLKISKAVAGGWSRGGFIATAFYDAYPKKVLGLILEDGGSVSINTNYHKMDSVTLLKKVKENASQVLTDTSYATAFEAYRAFFDKSQNDDQFELLNWVKQDKTGKWVFGAGLWKLFNMSTYEQSLDNILRPTRAPLFAESMSVIEPKIIFRNLKVPVMILDPVSKGDLFPFEKENQALKNKYPYLISHEIFEDTGHNIHYQRPEKFTDKLIAFLQTVRSFAKK